LKILISKRKEQLPLRFDPLPPFSANKNTV
jgi:hypothetical protein